MLQNYILYCVSFLLIFTLTITSTQESYADPTFIIKSGNHGPSGANVIIEGTGYTPNLDNNPYSVSISYDGSVYAYGITTDSTGYFTTTFVIPGSNDIPQGHTITVSDSYGNTSSQTYTVESPIFTMIPANGPSGARVSIEGTGFAHNLDNNPYSVSISYDGSVYAYGITTDSTGHFTTTFVIPGSNDIPQGHTITVSDSYGNTSSQTYTVVPPTFTICPANGPVGNNILIEGTGFAHNLDYNPYSVSISYDGSVYAYGITTDSTGHFTTTFVIPSGQLGDHTITVSDSYGNTLNQIYTITTTSPVFSPTITVNNISNFEGDSDNDFEFTVSRSCLTTGATDVTYFTEDGTASSSDYYTPPSNTIIHFANGETTKKVPVKVIGDPNPEQNETFKLKLSCSDCNLADNEGIASIVNDDYGTPPPGITINIDTNPNNPQNFGFVTTGGLTPVNFSLDDDSDPILSNTRTYSDVPPGTYTITEGFVSGFALTNLECSDPDNGTTVNLVTRVATIDVDAGELITCKYTNAQTGTITIIEDTIPDDSLNFAFTTTGLIPINFSLDDDADAALPNTRVYSNVVPGNYIVTENIATGFTLSNLTCVDPDNGTTVNLATRAATIDLDSGENITCTYTNTPPTLPKITINNISKPEPNSGTPNFDFIVTRSDNLTPISVQYKTTDGTATSSDYVAISPPRILDFAAGGPLTSTITVTVTSDNVAEPDETFYLELSNCIGCEITTSQGIGTIQNDDIAGIDVRTLDRTGNIGTYTSIAIGNDGFPVMSYRDETNNDLKFVHCTNVICSTQNAPRILDSTGNVGTHTSIAIGADGFPVVSYRDDTNNDLKFVHCTNVICSTQDSPRILDNTGNVGTHTSIAIGNDGFPVISYRDGTNNDLKFVHCTNVICSTQDSPHILDSTGNVGTYTSIAIGNDGFPVVIYRDETNNDLKFVHCTNVICSTQDTPIILDRPGNVGTYTSIAIGTDSFPVISYRDATNNVLKFVHCTSVNCSTRNLSLILDNTGNVGTHTSIAIGADGFPVVSYRDNANNDLKFVHCTSVNCSTQDTPRTLDSLRNVGIYTSIAIGTDGFPVMSYRDATNDNLKVAHCTNSQCN